MTTNANNNASFDYKRVWNALDTMCEIGAPVVMASAERYFLAISEAFENNVVTSVSYAWILDGEQVTVTIDRNGRTFVNRAA